MKRNKKYKSRDMNTRGHEWPYWIFKKLNRTRKTEIKLKLKKVTIENAEDQNILNDTHKLNNTWYYI